LSDEQAPDQAAKTGLETVRLVKPYLGKGEAGNKFIRIHRPGLRRRKRHSRRHIWRVGFQFRQFSCWSWRKWLRQHVHRSYSQQDSLEATKGASYCNYWVRIHAS